MTDEDLDRIDAECARHVMGGNVPIIFRPTRSWSDAGEVVAKMHDASHKITIEFCPNRGVSKTWTSRGKQFIGTPELNPNPKPHYTCTIMGKSKQFAQCWEGMWAESAPTAPLAITLAALSACGHPWKGTT